MIIIALRLRNIKSFADEELRFIRGVNVIAGRNGAGKSTVIEAIGLALFDAWPRKFKEGNARSGFIRHTEREGSIEVDVLRGSERFTVRCDLASRKKKGSESIEYERVILDEHGAELANSGGRKKEFQDDIRRHILGEARIDDDKLFRDIIGTEQGGFDEPFTRNETERRELFEKILGIEDFQDFEKQFHAFVKWQGGQTKELSIRYDERSGIRAELETAATMLLDRELEFQTAQQTLADVSKRSAETKAAVDALSDVRDKLQLVRAEKQRMQEKLNGALDAEGRALALLEEAKRAAAAMSDSLQGFGQHVEAGKTLDALRKSMKERDSTKQQLAEDTTRFESTNAKLQAGREAVLQELANTRSAIEDAKQDILEREKRVASLREDFARLDDERKSIEVRAQLAGDLRSYVQDVNTTRKTLLDQGSILRGLRSTFEALSRRLDDISLEASFLPALREESEILFERFTAAEATTENLPALGVMLSEALDIEKRLQKQVKEAVKTVSTVKEQGVSERKQLEEKQLALKSAIEKEAQLTVQETDLTAEIATLQSAWQTASSALNAILDRHAKLDDSIAAAESDLERSRPAYEAYLAAQSTASQLSRRQEDAHSIAIDIAQSRGTLQELSAKEEQLSLTFSEADYAAAKQSFDDVSAAEKAAHAEHGRVSALVREQKSLVAKLRKELADFLKLEAMLAQARAESAFTGEVHQHVVRELAKHVGASIVSALSAFAAELYQRIAPEQGLRLNWDEQTYAVELRDGNNRVRGRELSGGQLMGVSLAVKLALIKWYSQCRIGFLDEPTTHLDKETRLHLADVIQHLEDLTGDGDPWFDQLFIISHEESFSGSGHRIELERSPDRGSKLMSAE
jgi:DNA repair protein SbcC/Rad50